MHRYVPRHLGTKYQDKQRRAAPPSMMHVTQFGGQGRAVGAVQQILAGLLVHVGNRARLSSDLD